MHSILWASLLLLFGATAKAALVPLSSTNTTNVSNSDQLRKRQGNENKIESAFPLNKRGQSLMADIFNHFGMFANMDIYTMRSNIPFPLAGDVVDFGLASAINTNSKPVCSAGVVDDIYNYGLLVGTQGSFSYPVVVNGNAFLPDPSVYRVTVDGDQCGKFPLSDSRVQFDYVRKGIYEASKYLASLSPDLRLDSNGDIVELGAPADPCYRVMTLNSCGVPSTIPIRDGAVCSGLLEDELSVADGIWLGGTSWTGPNNPEIFDSAETVVINIPILQNTTYRLLASPSLKIPACKTIYNIYAVNDSGDFDFIDATDKPYILQYMNTNKAFEGFILAHGGSIFNSGSIRGKIFGSDAIIDATGSIDDFQCGEFTGCVPAYDLILTPESSTCTPETTITETTTDVSTTTEGSTSTTDYKTITTTQDHTVASTTIIVTAQATSTIVTTTTNTYTKTYTSGASTVTDVVTTTKPVFVPVQNGFDDEGDQGWKHDGDWEKDDWKKDGTWEKGSDWDSE